MGFLADTPEPATTEADAARARLRLIEEATGIGSWELDLATGEVKLSANECALQGLPFPPPPEAATYEAWLSRVHPEDREAAGAAAAASLRDGTALRHEFRLRRPGGGWRWIEGRGQVLRGADGRPHRMIGVDIDITSRKEADAAMQLALREVEHRAKNALSTAQALVRLTRVTDPREFQRSVEQRLAALGRAHARLSGAPPGAGVALRPLIADEFAPYEGGHTPVLRGPEAAVTAGAVQPICMAVHELVTNAAKYGALSRPGGTVSLVWRAAGDGGLVLTWTEAGGPPVAGPPARRGFGFSMLDQLVRAQLGGVLRTRWAEGGLRVTIRLPTGCVVGG